MSEFEFRQIRKSMQKWFALALVVGMVISGGVNFIVSKIIFTNELVTTVYQTKGKVDNIENQLRIITRATETLQLNMIQFSKMHDTSFLEIPAIIK